MKKTLSARHVLAVFPCKLAISTVGMRMGSQVFRKLGEAIPISATEGNALISPGLGIFVSEPPVSTTYRQRIIDLYDQLRPSLRAYLGCLGITSDQAEDVIQEAFLRLVGHRFEQDATDNLRAWIFRVAHNLSMNIHRSERRSSYGSEAESRHVIQERADPRPSPEQQVLLDERMKRFEDAFGRLTPKQRQCVLLRAEGFRYREIACTLGISVQRVGELMQRSISLLGVRT